jgi:predicted PurR-regulated permease PerM
MEGKDVPTAPESLSGQPISPPLSDGPPRRSRVTGWALFAACVIIAVLLYEVRVALLPFVFAVAIAFVMDPIVKALQRRLRSPRWMPAALVYIAILAVFAGAGYWIVQSAAPGLIRVMASAPRILHHFLTEIIGRQGIDVAGHTYTPGEIVKETEAAGAAMLGTSIAGTLLGMVASFMFGSVLLLVLMPYFLISGPRLAAGTLWLLPPERRHSVEVVLPKLVPALRRYLIGLFLIVVYATSVGWIGFGAIFHLPHAILLGLSFGVLELMPAIGPAISLTIVGIVAIQQASFVRAALLMAFGVALRLSIDNLFGPLVLGEAARVHPVVIIIGFVVGAMLFGIVGILLAVPTAVVIKTALEHYYSEPVRAGE